MCFSEGFITGSRLGVGAKELGESHHETCNIQIKH